MVGAGCAKATFSFLAIGDVCFGQKSLRHFPKIQRDAVSPDLSTRTTLRLRKETTCKTATERDCVTSQQLYRDTPNSTQNNMTMGQNLRSVHKIKANLGRSLGYRGFDSLENITKQTTFNHSFPLQESYSSRSLS